MNNKDESVLIINGVTKKYPKSFYQFRALRACWIKSTSADKDIYIQALTESMKEVIEVYNMEKDALKELKDWKASA